MLILVCGPATPQQWKSSLASTASLRTGEAELVSSDALEMDSGNAALITYWEMRTDEDLDVYRRIDVVDSAFRAISQQCWKALRPAGTDRRAGRTEITSSDDVCDRPSDPDGISNVADCLFSQSSEIRTPYFLLYEVSFDRAAPAEIRERLDRMLTTIDPSGEQD